MKVCDFISKIEISGINQLRIGGKVNNQTGDQNGSHQIGISYDKSSDYKLTMYIYIDINIDGIGSSFWSSGSIAEYREHQGSEFDSTLTKVEEALVEHKLGHANYVFSTMKVEIKTKLDALEQEFKFREFSDN